MTAVESFLAALDRHRRRRRFVRTLEGARRGGRWGLGAALALLLLWALGVLPDPGSPFATLGAYAGLLAAGVALGAALPWWGARDRGETARALDGVLGPGDLAATAAAVAVRPSLPGRLREALLERASEAVGAVPVERAGPLPRPPWRLLGLAALFAVLLALLPKGGLGVLPGLGTGWGRGGLETGREEAPGGRRVETAERGDGREGGPAEPQEAPPPAPAEAAPDEGPPSAEEEPPTPPPPPLVDSLEVTPLARSYPPSGPVTVAVAARGGRGAGEGIDLPLFLSVDGGPPTGAGTGLRVTAGSPTGRAVDLRAVGGLAGALGPGSHRVVAELRDGSGRTVARSEPATIVVDGFPEEGGGGEDGKGEPPPEPEPSPAPEPTPETPSGGPEPPAPAPKPPAGAPEPPAAAPGEPEPRLPEPPPDLPPSAFERQFVRPLFGEGPEAVKRGPILVLDPEAARGDPPREMAPEEVLAEVRARAEEAARRETVAPRDREAVRRYFEALRRLLEEGR